MSKQKKRYIQLQKQRRARRKRVLAVLFIVIVGSCGVLFGSAFASAHGSVSGSPAPYKYYQSIEISKGDSLWGLARTYMSDQYPSEQAYIEEVKEINHLASNTLYESQRLIVPYFDMEAACENVR